MPEDAGAEGPLRGLRVVDTATLAAGPDMRLATNTLHKASLAEDGPSSP